MRTISAVFIVFFQFLGKLLSNKFVIIVLIGGIAALVIFKPFENQQPVQTPAYSETIPIKELAPTLIVTSTRLYYVYEYTMNDDVPVLQKYYVHNSGSGEWEKRTRMPFSLEHTDYRIINR